jgi:hypothetical protein
MENANEIMDDAVDQLMNEVYKLLMMNHISAFDETGSFDYSQFEDSSGIHKGELLFLLLLTHFEGRQEFEKCSKIVNLRKEFRAKFGTDNIVVRKKD